MSMNSTQCRYTPPSLRWSLGCLALALVVLGESGCSRPPRRAQYFPTVAEDGTIVRPALTPNQVQTVIGEDRQAALVLAPSSEWEVGMRIRIRRSGIVLGTALIMDVNPKGAVARIIALTNPERTISPGDVVEPIEVVYAPAKDSAPTKASENAVAPSLAGQPKTVDSRAYYELAAKVLRLPGDQSPEVRRLQEDLRKSLAPALLPEASK